MCIIFKVTNITTFYSSKCTQTWMSCKHIDKVWTLHHVRSDISYTEVFDDSDMDDLIEGFDIQL